MKKEILLVFILICHSDQRPHVKLDATNTTKTTDTITVTESSKSIENFSQATSQVNESRGTAAVSIQTSIDVSPNDPSEIFDDFKPSNYYRPNGNPIFEKPSPPVTHEVFYNPQYFKKPPNNSLDPLLAPSKTNEKNVIFPPTPQEYDSDHNHEPESRSPYNKLFTKAQLPLAQHPKPIKYDYGEIAPSFSSYDPNLYERHFGKYHGKELPHYSGDILHETPNFYHDVAHKKNDPWKSVLSFLATVLPVGLLLASFPPTVIKVNSTQYPYQFQKNATLYGSNDIIGRYKALRRKNSGRKINEGPDESSTPDYFDDCLKKKICENMKADYSPSEIESLLEFNKLNSTRNSPTIVEIAEAAVSASLESCQAFVCDD